MVHLAYVDGGQLNHTRDQGQKRGFHALRARSRPEYTLLYVLLSVDQSSEE